MTAVLVGLCFLQAGVNVALVLWVRYLDSELAEVRARLTARPPAVQFEADLRKFIAQINRAARQTAQMVGGRS